MNLIEAIKKYEGEEGVTRLVNFCKLHGLSFSNFECFILDKNLVLTTQGLLKLLYKQGFYYVGNDGSHLFVDKEGNQYRVSKFNELAWHEKLGYIVPVDDTGKPCDVVSNVYFLEIDEYKDFFLKVLISRHQKLYERASGNNGNAAGGNTGGSNYNKKQPYGQRQSNYYSSQKPAYGRARQIFQNRYGNNSSGYGGQRNRGTWERNRH